MKKKIFSILFALVLVLTLGLVTALPAGANEDTLNVLPLKLETGAYLGEPSGATAEWSIEEVDSGNYSAYLKTPAVDEPTGDEGRIVIDPASVGITTLSDIESISWLRYALAGYPAHLDITLDVDGTDEVLVAEMAANNKYWSLEPDAEAGTSPTMWFDGDHVGQSYGDWFRTFESIAEDGFGAIDDDTLLWVGSLGSGYGNAPSGTLEQWIAGEVGNDPEGEMLTPTISGDTPVVKLEIEIDNWVLQAETYVDDVTINGTTYDLEPLVIDASFYKKDATVTATMYNAAGGSTYSGFAYSDTTGDANPITFIITGTGGTYTGTFKVVEGVSPGAGELLVNPGDTIYVSCRSDWGAGWQTIPYGPTAVIDDTVPVVAIDAPKDGDFLAGAVSIAWTITEENPGPVELLIGGVVILDAVSGDLWVTDEMVGDVPTYPDGPFTIEVVVTDLAGNVGSDSIDVTVDNTDPVITEQVATPAVVAPDDGSTIVFTADVTDATSGIATVTIDLSTLTPAGGAAVLMLDDGEGDDAVAGDGRYTLSYVNNITLEDDYTLPVTATDKAGNTATADISLGVWSDTEKPIITDPSITYPQDMPSAPPGYDVVISATVTDNEEVKTVTATCEAFKDPVDMSAGSEYTGTGTVADIASGTYLITITAVDWKNNTQTDTSLVLVVDTGAAFVTVPLEQGWNLISLPLIPDDATIDVVLAGIVDDISNVTSVYYWYNDGTSTGWQIYVPLTGGTLTTMEDGKAYFVFMSGEDDLIITGRTLPEPPATPPLYEVYAGWNFVGFKSLENMDNTIYLTNLGTSYTILWGYQPVGGYHLVHPGGFDMEVGYGYWLYLDAESGIIVPPA